METKDTAGIIARLEAASGPDREIDGAIALCINPEAKLWTPEWWSGGRDEYLLWPDPKPGVARYEQVEHYTSSIDAALSLIPADVVGYEIICFENGSGFQCCVGDEMADAKTAALGICIAALRARSQGE